MVEFPLLSIPAGAQKNVLRTMDYPELIAFSLSSKASKLKTMSLKYTAERANLQCAGRFELHIFYRQNVKMLVHFQTPHHIRLGKADSNAPLHVDHIPAGEYRNESFEARDWFSHLKSIFHVKQIQNMTVLGERMPPESIKNDIGSMTATSLFIASRVPEYTESLIENLPPVDAILKMLGSFQRGSRVLLQNLIVLHVMDCENWGLNDLLMMNAKYAYLHSIPITSRDMNRFLKLWMKGSNPHLIHFQCVIGLANDYDKEEVGRGIDGFVIPEATIRRFDKRVFPSGVERQEVRGGFDIRRCDGARGTVFFENDNCFKFVVWQ